MDTEQEVDEQAADAETKNKPVNVAKKGWKEGLKFGKLPDMPAKNWKKSLINLPGIPDKKPASKKPRSK